MDDLSCFMTQIFPRCEAVNDWYYIFTEGYKVRGTELEWQGRAGLLTDIMDYVHDREIAKPIQYKGLEKYEIHLIEGMKDIIDF